MAYYMGQAAYTAEALAALIRNPQNRRDVVKETIEKLGGRLEGLWFAFGEYDVVLIMEIPDNVTATAFSLVVAASGSLRDFKTTPLMTAEEAMDAMTKAGEAGYRPPAG